MAIGPVWIDPEAEERGDLPDFIGDIPDDDEEEGPGDRSLRACVEHAAESAGVSTEIASKLVHAFFNQLLRECIETPDAVLDVLAIFDFHADDGFNPWQGVVDTHRPEEVN